MKSAGDYAMARVLFGEYAASLDFSLAFQSFDDELDNVETKYGPPGGQILLAWWNSTLAGCVALRSLGPGTSEMKRLFVRPDHRGLGIGKTLVKRIIEQAKTLGYTRMRLDTVSRMGEAVELYRSMGFREISPYCHNPLEDAVYLEIDLS